MNRFLQSYRLNGKDWVIIISFIMLPTLVLFYTINTYAALYMVVMLIVFFYWKLRSRMTVLHVMASFILAIIADHLASLVSLKLFSSIQSEMIFIIFRNIVFFIGLSIFVYLYKRVITYISSKYIISRNLLVLIIPMIMFTLIVFYINISMMSDKSSFVDIASNLWIFVVYIILITILFSLALYLTVKQYKVKQKEKENKNFELYVKSLEQVNNDIRKFRHDYINILSTMRSYIDDNDIEGLKEYFDQHILATQRKEVDNNLILGRLNNLEIKGIKGLLTTKIIQAQESGIEFHLEIAEPITFIHMNMIELNRILGVLLDNAIEASLEVSTPLIRVAIIDLDFSTMIVVLNKINNCSLKVHEMYKEGYSTKGKNRGVGLSILKEIVSRNDHVTLNTRIEPSYFIQELEIRKKVEK